MANFCTFNPLSSRTPGLSEGNTVMGSSSAGSSGDGNNDYFQGTIAATSGKFYIEVTWLQVTNVAAFGFGTIDIPANSVNINYSNAVPSGETFVGIQPGRAWKADNTATSIGTPSISTGDVIGIALNLDDDEVTFYQNGSIVGSTTSFNRTAGKYMTIRGSQTSTWNLWGFRLNCGQFPWRYDPPSGFVALSTENLPEPAISNLAAEKPEDHFTTLLYQGETTTSRSITGVGFQPDLIWMKTRSFGNTSHRLVDSVRGTGRYISANLTDAEQVASNGVSSFDSDGWSLGNGVDNIDGFMSFSGRTFVAWCWKAGGAAVENTDGSITSQVSANQDAGFSIVSFTGTGGNATVGHGLGAVPKFIIIKNRTVTNSWPVHHVNNTAGNQYLNSTNTEGSGKDVNSSSTTTFSLTTWDAANGGNNPMIAYCWAEVEGYSKIGEWTNNNSTDGTFVYCGFRPAFILFKNTDNVENWYIQDNLRPSYNYATASGQYLSPNLTNAEFAASSAAVDFLSNGFKIRTSNPASGEISFGTRNYIFIAFADSPFKYSSAR
jgi:hypothetical protein